MIYGSSMVLHNKAILLIGGTNRDFPKLTNKKKCLQLNNGSWQDHSTLNEERIFHSAVTTETASFIFGGKSKNTFEYLPKDSTKWILGKTEIPGGFDDGCAIVAKSEQEIWLIGGIGTENRILRFDVKNHTFRVLPSQLNVGRREARCAFIPNTTKIMITGGHFRGNTTYIYLNSTEIFDTEDGSVTMASPMNVKRTNHGMDVITINGEDRPAVFGGYNGSIRLSSIELYNPQKREWEKTDFKLNKGVECFGFLSVRLSDVMCHLLPSGRRLLKYRN